MSGFEWLCLIGFVVYAIDQICREVAGRARDAALRAQWDREDDRYYRNDRNWTP